MEGNNLIKKGVVVAVILLFISVSVIPSTGRIVEKKSTMPSSNGNTLYVGGSGPNNYTRIQDAIDNASDGDTVFVYSGIYNESITINNISIELIGEDKNTTIIDGSDKNESGIWLTSNNVTIANFKIQNNYYGGIYIRPSKDCRILNNIISLNRYGVFAESSSNITFICNSIIDNNNEGLHLYKSHGCLISGNLIMHNGGYHSIKIDSSGGTTITNNTISHNNGDGIDISCFKDEKQLITNNIICHNTGNGIDAFGNYSTISNNIIEYNKKHGILLDYSYHLIISNNHIANNNHSGLKSVWIFHSNISGNYIENNNLTGLETQGDNNTISMNMVINNNDYGINPCVIG